jgi:hypothetical protein
LDPELSFPVPYNSSAVKGTVVPGRALKAYRGTRSIFLLSAVIGSEWLTSHPGCFTPPERTAGFIEYEA